MNNLQKTYSQYLNISPQEIDFQSNFIPLPDGEFITICTGAASKSRVYDYFNKALSLLNLNYKIVQIGDPSDPPIYNSLDYRGKSLRQTVYILERSKLHIGNDHLYNHLAAEKGISQINLYAVTPALSSQPINFTGISIESPRNGEKPSYADEEPNKKINLIKPEQIAEAVSTLLKIPFDNKIETITIGRQYNEPCVDVVPDFQVGPGLKGRLACRFDISNNMQGLVHFYSLYTGPLLLSDPVDANFLANFKPRIPQILYFMDRNYSKGFVEVLHKSGIPYELITDKKDKELAALKMELFDYNQIKGWLEPDVSQISKDHSFESSRMFLSRGKLYPSRWHLAEGIELNKCDWKIGGALESRLFLESWDNYFIYNKS